MIHSRVTTGILAMAGILALSSCTPAPTPTQVSNGNTNIVTITNVNENSATIIQNTNVNGTTTTTAKKVPLTTQRMAPEGCSWEEAIFSQVRFLKYKCVDQTGTFTEKGGNIYSGSGSDTPIIEFFTKNAGESNENAIKRVALMGVPSAASGCLVVKSQQQRIGVDRYEIEVAQAIQDKYRAENPDGPWWEAGNCGTYEQTNGIQYFEFQPNQNKFFFIRVGQDNPGIDLDGIEIGMNN